MNAPDASGTALSGNFAIDPFVIPTGQMFVNFQSDGSKNDGYVLMEVEVVNKTGKDCLSLMEWDKPLPQPRSSDVQFTPNLDSISPVEILN